MISRPNLALVQIAAGVQLLVVSRVALRPLGTELVFGMSGDFLRGAITAAGIICVLIGVAVAVSSTREA
jgi:hypothetical protein